MEEKVLISLISVSIGWFLAQGTTVVRDWWASRKLRAGLLTELQDIQEQLQRVEMIHARQLQIAALKGMEPSAALPIQNMFFKQYFKDAFSHLNREQRLSYQLIHSTLDSLNSQNERLSRFAEIAYKDLGSAPDEEKISSIIQLWEERIVPLYKTALDVQWHFKYHLDNPTSPSYEIMGPVHESYLKFQQEVDEHIRDLTEKAKNLDRTAFEKTYDEAVFAKDRKTV